MSKGNDVLAKSANALMGPIILKCLESPFFLMLCYMMKQVILPHMLSSVFFFLWKDASPNKGAATPTRWLTWFVWRQAH